MDEVRRIWGRVSVLAKDAEKEIYARLGTERRLFIVKDKEGQTRLSTPLLLAGLVVLVLVVTAAPLVIVAFIGALLLKYEFVIAKEDAPKPR